MNVLDSLKKETLRYAWAKLGNLRRRHIKTVDIETYPQLHNYYFTTFYILTDEEASPPGWNIGANYPVLLPFKRRSQSK